jgi:hypothetical protein
VTSTDAQLSTPPALLGGWDDLVTTALLGTDRRPLATETSAGPVSEPAVRVLDMAAQHRAVRLAGASLAREVAPPVAPAERLTMAPRAAQELLAALLATADPGLVNHWLAVCAQRGLGAAPDLWPRLAVRAARHTGYDRRLLAQVLGPRGRWLLRQNPQWTRLGSVDPSADPPPRPGDPAVALAAVERNESPAHALELLLHCPDPWPAALTQAALRLVLSGQLGSGTRTAAVSVALRIPLDRADDVAGWLAEESLAAPVSVTALRARQLALAQLERTVSTRIEISESFGDREPAGVPEQDSTGEVHP